MSRCQNCGKEIEEGLELCENCFFETLSKQNDDSEIQEPYSEMQEPEDVEDEEKNYESSELWVNVASFVFFLFGWMISAAYISRGEADKAKVVFLFSLCGMIIELIIFLCIIFNAA